MNPACSVKDRIGVQIIDDLERSGKLRPGGTLVEATSGNTGVGLAMVAAIRGYKTIFVMSDKQSEEKRAALRAYGARVVLCPHDVDPKDPRSYYRTAERIVEETPGAVYANQYHNPSNPQAHYTGTGPEIWNQFAGKIDVVFAGMATGGTLSGLGRYLKEQNPKIRIIGIDPVGSLYYDYFHTGQLTTPHPYKVEGIGEDFLPSTLNFSYIDDVVRVNDKECFQMTRRLVREEGIFAGASSGAAVAGALKWLRLNATPETVSCVLLPDSGTRYISKVFNDNWMRENGFMDPEAFLGTVKDLLDHKGRGRELVSVRPEARVSEVVGILKLHGVSQLPVIDDQRIYGIVTENRILERALSGATRADNTVRDLVEPNYCTVDESTDVAVLTELFKRFKVAIVIDGSRPHDIITRIDLIDYIAKITSGVRERN